MSAVPKAITRSVASAVALALFAGQVQGDTYFQSGVASDLLVADGRVIFAQADGSLTALGLATGKVLLRKPGRGSTGHFQGKLELHPAGIVSRSWRSVAP